MLLKWPQAVRHGVPLDGKDDARVIRVSIDNSNVVLKRYPPARPTSRRLLRKLAALWRGDVPVEDLPAQQRRDFERLALLTWTRYGFRVPDPLTLDIQDTAPWPLLAMGWVEGPTLQASLRAADTLDEPRRILEKVLRDTAHRHAVAIGVCEPRLIHFDANTGNIILRGDEIVHLDFEMGRLYLPVALSAGIELAKFLCCAAGDLGPGSLDLVARLAVDAYEAVPDIVRDIPRRALQRPAQFLHNMRNSRRRRTRPGQVTLIDMAQALNAALSRKYVDTSLARP